MGGNFGNNGTIERIASVPLPAAIWLFVSGHIGLVGISRHKQNA
jgi:hypothetical protein